MNIERVPKNLPHSENFPIAEKVMDKEFASYCNSLRRLYFLMILPEILLLAWWCLRCLSLRLFPFAVVLLCSIILHLKLSTFMRIDDNVVQSVGVSRMISYRTGGLDAAVGLAPIRKFVMMSQYPPLVSWNLFSIVGLLVFAFATAVATLLAILISIDDLAFVIAFAVHRTFVCLLHYRQVQTFYERAVIDSARKIVCDEKRAKLYAQARGAQRVNAMLDQLRSYYNGNQQGFLVSTSEIIRERRQQRTKLQQQQQAESQRTCLQTSVTPTAASDSNKKRIL